MRSDFNQPFVVVIRNDLHLNVLNISHYNYAVLSPYLVKLGYLKLYCESVNNNPFNSTFFRTI